MFLAFLHNLNHSQLKYLVIFEYRNIAYGKNEYWNMKCDLIFTVHLLREHPVSVWKFRSIYLSLYDAPNYSLKKAKCLNRLAHEGQGFHRKDTALTSTSKEGLKNKTNIYNSSSTGIKCFLKRRCFRLDSTRNVCFTHYT